MTLATIVIPGKPFAKQRPRFSRKSGSAYTPKETVSFERQVGILAAQEIREPLEGPIRLTVHATFEPAKSWSKKKREAHLNRPHMQKPDLDNIFKAIADGLNRVAFADDKQISEFRCRKMWGPTARTVIYIEKAGAHQ